MGKIKHGLSKLRLYRIWLGMKARCYGFGGVGYRNYGKKGIKIYKTWHNFANFNKWALKNGYTNNLTIDRINKEKDYKPSNCQWISLKENKIKEHKKYFYKGIYYTLPDVCKLLNLKVGTVQSRMYRGKTFEEAINF